MTAPENSASQPPSRQTKMYEVPLPLKKAGIPGPGSLIRFKNDATIRVYQPGQDAPRVDTDDDIRDPSYWTIAAGTSATITRVISNTDTATIFVTVEILTQDATGSVVNGWYSVVESSKYKEWDWMVPPMRLKMIKENFEKSFDIVIAA